MNNTLPIFLNNLSTKIILEEVKNLIPDDVKVYLFGGAVRNAVHFDYFKEEMTQRDFDLIIIGDVEKFTENLINAGFVFGKKNSEKSKVLKKARVSNPIHIYEDYLYLDCKIYPSTESIETILEKISDFTIAGVAIDLQDIFSLDWLNKIYAIPDAISDIQNRNLKVVISYPANLYKIIRMMSKGYNKPIDLDIKDSLDKLKEITKKKFETEVEKTIRYVGGEDELLKIVNKLGINKNILDFKQIKA